MAKAKTGEADGGVLDDGGDGERAEHLLGLLDAVDSDEALSQRSLAARLGIALGLTNALLRRCLRKGLVKMQDAPARRYRYYLTPEGFREKSRLVAEYLSFSLRHFRAARDQYESLLEECHRRGDRAVVLYGTGELAEIATVAAHGARVRLLAAVDPARNEPDFCGLPVAHHIGQFRSLDAVVLCVAQDVQAVYDRLVAELGPDKVLVPPMLRVRLAARDEKRAASEGKRPA